jgi:flagella basal body P-ring formation protein FlgA
MTMMLALLLPVLMASGGSLPVDWTDAALRAVEVTIRSAAGCSPEDLVVEVRGSNLPPAACPDGGMVRIPGGPLTVVRGNVSVPVELVAGQTVCARGIVSVRVRTFGSVVVALRALGRHAVIGPGDIALRRCETTSMPSGVVSGDSMCIGMRTTRMLNEGTVLRADMLETLPLVEQGTPVVLRVHSGAAVVSVAAVARTDGRLHEWITVERMPGHTATRARVAGPGTVERILE